MVEAGYAYHYQQYSGNCESAENLGWAEKIARDPTFRTSKCIN
jgi:hypothetical protein